MADRTCVHLLTALLVASATSTTALQVRIYDEEATASSEESSFDRAWKPEVGDGSGRPLFNIGSVKLPKWYYGEANGAGKWNNTRIGSRSACVGVALDLYGSSYKHATNPKDNQAHQSFYLKVAPVHAIPVGKEARASAYVAKGCFLGSLKETGWNHLNISTSADVGSTDNTMPLSVRIYSAGMIEGLLTFQEITHFRSNVKGLLYKDLSSAEPAVAKTTDRAVRMSLIAWEQLSGGDAHYPPKDDVPRHAWAALLQLRGIRDGYNQLAKANGQSPLSMYELMLMNMHFELPAIVDIMSRSQQSEIWTDPIDWTDKTVKEWKSKAAQASFLQSGSQTGALRGSHSKEATTEKNPRKDWLRWPSHMPRGSAVVRRIGPVGTPEDLISGHVTHGNYGDMLRIIKTYEIDFGTPVKSVLMTSYPGCISSTDDWFQTSTGLVIMSTNLWIPQTSIFSEPLTTNEGLPSFLRAIIATRTSVKPREWVKVYSFLTGIAGGKQWLLADYSNLNQKQKFKEGTVFMAETLPTLTKMNDVTRLLNANGFVEAHGAPHFAQIRALYGLPVSGPGTFKEHLGSDLLDKATTIEKLSTARDLLDTFIASRQPTETEISQIPITARNDLNGGHVASYMPAGATPLPEGGLDAKLTSRCFMQAMSFQARSGPAYNALVPAFQWKNFTSWPHAGLPDKYNFTWLNVDQHGHYPVKDAPEYCKSPNIAPVSQEDLKSEMIKLPKDFQFEWD